MAKKEDAAYSLAKKIVVRLVEIAEAHELITYKELGQELGVHWRSKTFHAALAMIAEGKLSNHTTTAADITSLVVLSAGPYKGCPSTGFWVARYPNSLTRKIMETPMGDWPSLTERNIAIQRVLKMTRDVHQEVWRYHETSTAAQFRMLCQL